MTGLKFRFVGGKQPHLLPNNRAYVQCLEESEFQKLRVVVELGGLQMSYNTRMSAGRRQFDQAAFQQCRAES